MAYAMSFIGEFQQPVRLQLIFFALRGRLNKMISRHHFQLLFASIAVAVSASCTPIRLISESTQEVGEEDAIVVLNVVAEKRGTLTLSPTVSDANVSTQSRIDISTGDNVFALNVKKGQQIYFTRFREVNAEVFWWSGDSRMLIVARESGVTYVGDIVLKEDPQSKKLSISIHDNEYPTMNAFREKYPGLLPILENRSYHKDVLKRSNERKSPKQGNLVASR